MSIKTFNNIEGGKITNDNCKNCQPIFTNGGLSSFFNQKSKCNTIGGYTLYNIFFLNNIDNNFFQQPIYKINSSNITSDMIFFMNTSKNYSTLNIHFDVLNLSSEDVICTFCTFQQFINNKSLHNINLINVPIELKYIIKQENYPLQMCIDTKLTINKKNCPLYFEVKKKVSGEKKENKNNHKNVLEKPFNVNLNCKELLNGNEKYINEVSSKRIVFQSKTLPMDCPSIYKRGFNINQSLSDIEKKYSLAFAFNIYKNYEVIELKLLATYSPNNHYCYMIDSKNPELFEEMIQLEKCLPNVYVPRVQYDMKSNGENGSLAHYECMKRLIKTNFNYIFLLQNDEMALKTNRELLEILEATNFVMEIDLTDNSKMITERVNHSLSWTYKDLNIFLEDDYRKNLRIIMDQEIQFAKGLISTGLPRDTIDYLLNKLNITTFLKQLNTNLYGNDELTWQTLLTNEILLVPGYVPLSIANKYFPEKRYLGRDVIWYPDPCKSNDYHHGICTRGVESLDELRHSESFFIYRFREEFDYGAIQCFGEYLYNKTHFETYERPDLWFYYNLPQSIYKRLGLTNDMDFLLTKYCLSYVDEILYKISLFCPYDIFRFVTRNRDIRNIFNIQVNGKFGNLTKKFTYSNNDVDGFFIYYMNTSQKFTETNIVFENSYSAYDEALCTYCTLQKYIDNKELFLVNLHGLPFNLYYKIKKFRNYEDLCLDSEVALDREHCPKKTFMELRVNKSEPFQPDSVAPFWKPSYVNLDCKRIVDNDQEYIQKVSKNPIKYQEEDLSMACKDIKKRSFNIEDFPNNPQESRYSIAYAYNVYKNYPILERRLSAHYSPRNHYCYLVDSKSPQVREKLVQLSHCLPNVYVTEKSYNMTSSGDYASLAHYECMKLLVRKKWDYLYIQQNDDFPLKTTRQLLEILESMKFPVEMGFVDPSSTVPLRYNTSDLWRYKDLNFFLDGDKRKDDLNMMYEKIVFQKGSVCLGIPRMTVDYMVKRINIKTFMRKLNVGIYGHDELTWQTLLSDDYLQIPGSTPRKCIPVYRPRETFLNRKVIWEPEECPTKKYHHSICTWGAETLPEIKNYNELFGYRFRGDVDYGSEVCWNEYLYNMTHFYRHKRLDLWHYYNLPQSALQRLRVKHDIEGIRSCKI
uniref:Glycosyltransferase family 92 protein n=1 Tax=Strongyloides stercoralis TaxID=6248 RepID=A0AAF5HZL2_STRER